MLGLCVLYVQAWPTCLPSTGEVAQFCTIYPPLHLAARLGPVWIPGVGFSLGSHCDEAQSLVGLSDWAETVNRRSEDGETILTRRTRRSVFFFFFLVWLQPAVSLCPLFTVRLHHVWLLLSVSSLLTHQACIHFTVIARSLSALMFSVQLSFYLCSGCLWLNTD